MKRVIKGRKNEEGWGREGRWEGGERLMVKYVGEECLLHYGIHHGSPVRVAISHIPTAVQSIHLINDQHGAFCRSQDVTGFLL
jgi:hypothetical protein